MHIIALQPGTILSNIVKLVGSKKRKVILAKPTVRVVLSGTHWDGGSRSDYFLVDLKTSEVSHLGHWNPPQYGGPSEDPIFNLKSHQAVVEAGIFCGKPSTPTIYLHPMWGQELIEEVK